jgi:DNA-binding SARP family transcriptional activator
VVHLHLLGTPRIVSADGAGRDIRGQKPWALLARLVLTERPLSRRQLAVELFPDADDPLGSVRWTLTSLRKALGARDVFVGDPVSNELPEHVSVDVLDVLAARSDPPDSSILLEGLDPPCGPEFLTWLLIARQRVAARIAALIREQTLAALARGDAGRAVELAGHGARLDPFDEPAQVLLVQGLVMAGHPAAALDHVVAVEALYQRELGVSPTPALRSAARPSITAPPPGVSPSAVAATLLDAGRAALAAGASEAGLDCLRRALAQSELTGDCALQSQAMTELGSALIHTVRGFDDEGVVHLETAAHLASEVGDTATVVHALRELAYADTIAGRRLAAAHHLERASELAAGEPVQLAAIHAIGALNESDWGHHDDALTRFEEALDLARAAGERRWQGWCLGLGGWAALRAGQPARATKWETACRDIINELHWISFEPWATAVMAEADLVTGRQRDTTIDALERSFAMSCQLEDPCWEGSAARMLAIHYQHRGDHQRARQWIIDARQRCTRRSDTWTGLLGTILLTEADILAAAHDQPGEQAALRDLVALSARAHLDHHLARSVQRLHH